MKYSFIFEKELVNILVYNRNVLRKKNYYLYKIMERNKGDFIYIYIYKILPCPIILNVDRTTGGYFLLVDKRRE